VVRRIGQIYRLLNATARAELAATAVLLAIERWVLAAAAIGLTRRLVFTWAATGVVGALWALRGLLRQEASTEVREKLTMTIAHAALRAGGSLLPGEEAEAAVFEARFAAEQVLLRLLPALFAEPIAFVVLVAVTKPTGLPAVVGAVTIVTAAGALAFMRKLTTLRQRAAWRQQLVVAQSTLTSIRAANEIAASGHEAEYLENLRVAVHDWARAAARAERGAAFVQRIPLAAGLCLVAFVVVTRAPLPIDSAIRLAVLLPPLAGLMRTVLELVRLAPKINTLGPVLDPPLPSRAGLAFRELMPQPRTAPSGVVSAPPKLPCEIRFERVSFGYRSSLVLENISFVWRPGEMLGIRGPNGSGKSTLLLLLLGLLEPTGGRILVGGFDLRDLDLTAWRRSVAYLPQRPYLSSKATVYEAMQLTLPNLSVAEAQVALARTGAWERLRQSNDAVIKPLQIPMSSLSVGMRQRVLLSRAFARATPVLLLDEPDENLDADTCSMLTQLMRNLGPSHMVAVATHDASMLSSSKAVVELGVPLAFTRAMP
jgi:ABC-type multidrug transport system fused ATPase/permease subunit